MVFLLERSILVAIAQRRRLQVSGEGVLGGGHCGLVCEEKSEFDVTARKVGSADNFPMVF